MPKIHTILLLGLGVAAPCAYLLFKSPTHAAKAVALAEHQPDSELAAQLARLERRTNSLQMQLNRRNADDPAPTEDSQAAREEAEPEESPLARLPVADQEELIIGSTLTLMEETVTEQAPDQEWTKQMDYELQGQLSDPSLTATQAQAVDCGSSLCRITFSHEDLAARETFQGQIGTGAMRGNAFFHFDPESLQTVVYVAPAGKELPKIDLELLAATL